MSDIRFDCPNCHRPMTGPQELYREVVACPDCQFRFMPKNFTGIATPPIEEKPAPPKQTVIAGTAKLPNAEQINSEIRAAQIRRRAHSLELAAVWLAALGGVCLLLLLVGSINGDRSDGLLLLAGAMLGIGFWAYLTAQIIHIRANTEK